MKKNYLFFVITTILMIACSKSDGGGENNTSIDPKIIEEVQYWRLDSGVEWIDNVPKLTFKDHDTSFQYYYFKDGRFLARLLYGGYQEIIANYEIANNEITIHEEELEIYIKLLINQLDKKTLHLKEDYSNREFYADSIIQYFSASNEDKWNWADRLEF